jgi:hypothetical protein
VLRRIFGPKKERKMDHGENCIMMNFMDYIFHLKLLGLLYKGG